MPNRLLSLFAFVVILGGLGCKGCQQPESCEEVGCDDPLVCIAGQCQVVSSCDPECADDEVCQAGQCVSLDPQCTEVDEECDASLPVNDGFVCLDLDGFGPQSGVCATSCDAAGNCAPGSLCFYLGGIDDQACSAEADCSETADCVDGICRETVCRPSECDGFLDTATCESLYSNVPGFENGSQCYAVGNDARYCYPAGGRQEGEACTNAIDAIVEQRFDTTCAPGLACVDSVCQVACADDATCTGDQACLLESEDFVDIGVGVCGDGCTPFEAGACGADQTCLPVSGEEGVCIAAGTKTAFEDCTPGEGECEDGTLCVTYQNSPSVVARCQPVCDVTVAPPNDDGSVGDFAQSQRDATCPQPESIDAWVSFVNLADVATPVDVYVGDQMTPQVEGLALDARSDGDAATAGFQWTAVEPGTYAITILPTGAPRTDPPLAELNVSWMADQATTIALLPVADTTDEVEAVQLDGLRDLPATEGTVNVRFLAALVDVPSADVLLVPTGDDLSDPAVQVELADDIAPGVATFVDGATSMLAGGDFDLLVLPPGDPRTDRTTALYEGTVTLTADTSVLIAARGTVNPDDAAFAGEVTLELVEPPPPGSGGPSFTCVDLGNEVFGFCQQNCPGDETGFDGGRCEGDAMGCHPSFLDATGSWATLCAPLGTLEVGDACDPFNEFDACGEGTYCLEYGNTAPNFDSVNRGRCVSYCIEEEPDASLGCEPEQACQPISVSADFVVGRCGFPCEPDADYTDTTCPAGLQSCKPAAALVSDPANPDVLPVASVQPSFCSASGDIAAETPCTGSDCVPGSECMFPRSQQQTFTSTLVSQYFGASGLTPVCEPQCDPFDGDSSSTTCADGETCLFNFPWSAEVGHCAPIVEERAPLEACSNPGQSCGEDSICVIQAGAAVCLQFCQYSGPGADGELQVESCAAGFLCSPLVADIGVCLSP